MLENIPISHVSLDTVLNKYNIEKMGSRIPISVQQNVVAIRNLFLSRYDLPYQRVLKYLESNVQLENS